MSTTLLGHYDGTLYLVPVRGKDNGSTGFWSAGLGGSDIGCNGRRLSAGLRERLSDSTLGS